MHQIQLNEQLYKQAQRRASEAGFASVDEFVAQVVSQNLSEETDNFDHLFTPAVIGHLDRISEEIKAGGKTYTMAEVNEHLEKTRRAWLANHAS